MSAKKLFSWLAIASLVVVLAVILVLSSHSEKDAGVPAIAPEPTKETAVTVEPQQPTEAEPAPTVFRIILNDGGEETILEAQEGDTIPLPAAAAPLGYVFSAWEDQDGIEVDPDFKVTGDMTLYAVFRPALTDLDHAPYLSMDASWRTRPNDPVSHEEAVNFVASLLSIPAASEEPETEVRADVESIYSENLILLRSLGCIRAEEFDPAAPVTQSELFFLLAPFCPAPVTDCEIKGIAADDDLFSAYCLAVENGWISADEAEPERAVTRLEYARAMNDVLHRSADPYVLAEAEHILPDLPDNDEDALTMLEATIRHTASEADGSELWADVELPDRPLQDFTTGDLEVDAWIKGIFEERLTDNMTQREKLAALYRYVRDTSRYRKGEIHEEPDTAWVLEEARKMMEEGGGNCFTYSSTLCELYRALGVDAKIYAGTISEQMNPHAWVEANINGTVYIFDVEMEATRLRFHHPYIDFFMRTYYDLKGWDYKRDFVVEWS